MPKPISAVEPTPIRVVIITLDNHLAATVQRAEAMLRAEIPGLTVSLHAASDWETNPESLERCRRNITQGDIIFTTMMFLESQIQVVLPWLQARRDECDAMVGCMSAGEVIRTTRLGKFSMDGEAKGPMALLKRLRGKSKGKGPAGAKQMATLRRLPKILRFIPGTAQDVRAYFLCLQYWLAGSEANIANLVRFLINRYAEGERQALRGRLQVGDPVDYPETGLYHPRLPNAITSDLAELKGVQTETTGRRGKIGLLVMRSYVLAGNTSHYDAVIDALEARGFEVLPAFASGLDSRPAIDAFFVKNGETQIEALLSLTGFSLVGGPAYNDSDAAQEVLTRLDVPYLAAHAVEFQTLGDWSSSDRGLMPIEATLMVALPELDGATSPILFGGRHEGVCAHQGACPEGRRCAKLSGQLSQAPASATVMTPCLDRVRQLADRLEGLIGLRRKVRTERKLGIVLFNFPPNAGNTGTAAYLSVFESLYNTLRGLKDSGYTVEVPPSVDALRDAITKGNAERFGAVANVHHRISSEDYVRHAPYLGEIEAQWGPAPGKHQTDGASLFVLGAQFGNVFVGIQPAFGYEGDPMRLLFEKGFAPTHAFAAFYQFLKDQFAADAVLHFGTHGALEFMPGKQTALSHECWPDRLIGALPNYYLYAANNPSEGAIARRRSGATLLSYMTPPVAQAGLYKGLIDLRASLERWRRLSPAELADFSPEAEQLAHLIQSEAAALDLTAEAPLWTAETAQAAIAPLGEALLELEYTLIPHGLHVLGQAATANERADFLQSIAEASHEVTLSATEAQALVSGSPEAPLPELDDTVKADLKRLDALLAEDHELPALIHALDGTFVPPAPGGDVIRTPDILPTGRNIHGFDPFRIPSKFAVMAGRAQAALLLDRQDREKAENGALAYPESIALVLWGTDNIKTEGEPVAQALALIGAAPRFDGYGRLCGADLIPLEELGRPRIDVVMTLSGIFRDLLPLQTKLLAEAALLAAQADEPLEQNFIRKHALQYQQAHHCSLEKAALRVFSNADGTYGSNVNFLIDNGQWDEEEELAQTYTKRKCFAYGVDGKPVEEASLLTTMLADVELTYQNLESVELGVTTVDNYFDTLGGISTAVSLARGEKVPVFIGDRTRGEGKVRTLKEQVALETRTRVLNPKWYEGMLKHGYEGVRQIEAHVTHTVGWSATTGAVDPWVYKQVTQTYLLDPDMRERLASLNPTASARMANRLIEAHERNYWTPDEGMLEALREIGEDLEDRVEGVTVEAAA